jgi:serine/threonine-protein kinase
MTTRLVEPGTTVTPQPGDATTAVVGGRPPIVATPLPAGSRPRRRKRGWIVAAIVAVVVALAAVAGWWFADGRYTNAPNVVGLSRSAATDKLTSAGLHVKFLSSVYSVDAAKGSVASETHASHVTKGSTVDLRLSRGPRPHILPDYAGQSVSQVKSELSSIHITVSSVRRVYSEDIHQGLVAGTNPGAGETVLEGRSLVLQVSKGVQHVAIPQVAGLTVADASTALRDKGFSVAPPVQHFSSSVPNGTVITSHPTQGHSPPKGSPVTLVVSEGPRTFQVPPVVGEGINQAVKDIKAAGFNPDPVQTVPGGPGTVLKETPSDMEPHSTTIELDYF